MAHSKRDSACYALPMWTCPRCSKQYPEPANCDCGNQGAPYETPAVQGIFSSGPAIDEERDRKRRNNGLWIALADILISVALLKVAHDLERAAEGMAQVLIGAGAVYWIARRVNRGSGLALLVGAATYLALLLIVCIILVPSPIPH